MALTLAQLNAQLVVLKNALGAGVLNVRHGDVSVQYRSVAELRTAIGAIEQDIAQAGGNAMIRSFKITTSKDL